ncbi:MAG: fructose bisphosphate aldolase [Actinomycetaceae bacterium]|nr:fructose bisphosphate aldolase [Actinomycetaceae bacterium]MDU0970309.1 fructose bisphosphate aldolase [Actinomycetaceae bacterium]
MNKEQFDQMAHSAGFIAALDQSGGSTPRALAGYGITEDQWATQDEMFDLVHAMRTRVMTNPAFTSDKIIGAILFEMTMDRTVAGKPTATYLWEEKHIVPFLKIDKGLADLEDGVKLMKPIPGLDATLDRAVKAGIFGTKERSVIYEVNAAGIEKIVDQQFELARAVCAKGLVPIIEPEVDIHLANRAEAERILVDSLKRHLDQLGPDELVMFKLTIPTEPNLYQPLMGHPNLVRIVALSGGFTRDEACEKLAENTGLIASFSRALLQGLTAQQTDEEFTATLRSSIDQIAQASAK